MTKKQTSSNPPAGGPPRISIFDKKGQANLSRFAEVSNMPHNQSKVSLPQVRINQHKGA